MATGDRYSQPTYAQSSQGTADAPKLGASSDNVNGYDQTTAAIVAALKKDAATNGLTAWGLSFLKQLGETIKPEWLKENSKEWFNKPLPDPLVPPKDDFLKLVEPAVMNNTALYGRLDGGIVTQAIRDAGGFGGLWKKYHAEVGDLDAQYAQLPDYLDPKRTQEKTDRVTAEAQAVLADRYKETIAKYNIDPSKGLSEGLLNDLSEGKRFESGYLEQLGITNYTPGNPLGGAKIAADKRAADKADQDLRSNLYKSSGTGTDQEVRKARDDAARRFAIDNPDRRNPEEMKRLFPKGVVPATYEWPPGTGTQTNRVQLSNPGTTPPTGSYGPVADAFVPTTPAPNIAVDAPASAVPKSYTPTLFVPAAGQQAEGVAPPATPEAKAAAGILSNGAGQGVNTFLPPYLQPGAPTGTNNITGTLTPVPTQIASPTPIAPPLTPLTPFVPQVTGIVPPVTPGLFPPIAGMPQTNFGGINTGGGFAKTAKLLELPFYLRKLMGKAY